MMNKNKIVKAMPTVLFAIGIVGIFVSEVMCARDTLKAEKVLNEKIDILDGSELGDDGLVHITNKPVYAKEVVKATWKCFVPTVLSTTVAITSLAISRRLTAKQIAALSTAVATAGGLVTKYRDKIREYADEEILHNIDREIASEEIVHAKAPIITNNTFTSHEELDLNDDGTALFFDPFTGIKFETSKLAFLGAKYYLNRNYAIGSAAPLSMFYEFLGIALPEEYKYAGWEINDDGYNWIDIDVVRSEEPDKETGKMYYIIEYQFEPGDYEDNYSIFPSGNPLDEFAALDSFGSAV